MLEDVLEESWAYQEMVEKSFMKGFEKGRQEGLKKGIEQGIEQGRAQALEQGIEQGVEQERARVLEQQGLLLMNYIEFRFPASVPTARRCVEVIGTYEEYQRLMLRLFALNDAGQVEQQLRECLKQKQS